MAHDHTTESHSASHTFGADTRAAFLGLILGAIAVFAVVRTIVALTNAHYAGWLLCVRAAVQGAPVAEPDRQRAS